jgi:hypothetical protein
MATLILHTDLASPASFGRGGLAAYELQWVHGLERLGHEVVCLEFLSQDPGSARESVIRHFRESMAVRRQPGLCALLVEPSLEVLHGLGVGEITRQAGRAAAVLTLAARYRREPYPLVEEVRPRVLIEQDPGYTHLWAVEGDPADIFGVHDIYYTVGGTVGSPRCSLPTLGISWRPVWNPVVLDWWAGERDLQRDRFTTVADWRGYGYLEFEGRTLGPKAEEFRNFITLPRLAGERLEIALNIDAEDPDVAYLHEHGWLLENQVAVSSLARYRDYVTGSLGEFSCAKGGYVGTHCGWFSDRSACYLAAGRPVVLQATGFENLLPTGKGLFAVATVGEGPRRSAQFAATTPVMPRRPADWRVSFSTRTPCWPDCCATWGWPVIAGDQGQTAWINTSSSTPMTLAPLPG